MSVLALALSIAAAAAPECVPVDGIGCFYAPSGLSPESKAPLLVYLRGHYESYKGAVPSAQRADSAKQAFGKFELGPLADREGMAVLVTGSSDVGVTDAALEALQSRFRLTFGALYLASHSGGNKGLKSTLGKVRRPDRIVMLDNFYFEKEFSLVVQQQVAAGTVCAGFFTRHKEQSYEANFKPFAYCPIDDGPGFDHNLSVNRCLGKYLHATTCR